MTLQKRKKLRFWCWKKPRPLFSNNDVSY